MFELQKVKNEIEISGFNSIYYFEFGKDFSHPPEKHDFWEMVYVDNGEINAITNGVGVMLTQGQVIFHKPMEVHAHVSDKKVANNMLVISFSTNSKAMDYFESKTFSLDKTGKTLLSLFMREAEKALGIIPGNYENKENLVFLPDAFGAPQLLKCYLTEFLIRLIRNEAASGEKHVVNEQSRHIATNSICELVCDYIKGKIYSSISLNELCSNFLIGKTQLCKIFKEYTGSSPIEYYYDLKIKEAKKLIREKNYNISQISDMLGYSSIHNFSRAFKKAVGYSPTAYSKTIL